MLFCNTDFSWILKINMLTLFSNAVDVSSMCFRCLLWRLHQFLLHGACYVGLPEMCSSSDCILCHCATWLIYVSGLEVSIMIMPPVVYTSCLYFCVWYPVATSKFINYYCYYFASSFHCINYSPTTSNNHHLSVFFK